MIFLVEIWFHKITFQLFENFRFWILRWFWMVSRCFPYQTSYIPDFSSLRETFLLLQSADGRIFACGTRDAFLWCMWTAGEQKNRSAKSHSESGQPENGFGCPSNSLGRGSLQIQPSIRLCTVYCINILLWKLNSVPTSVFDMRKW